MKERRFKRVRRYFLSHVGFLITMNALRPGSSEVVSVNHEIPEGAQVWNIYHAQDRDGWWVCVEHESFDPVCEGEMYPEDHAGFYVDVKPIA